MKELELQQVDSVVGGFLFGRHGGNQTMSGFTGFLADNTDKMFGAQDAKNYAEYRAHRDRSGDRAAQARSRSRSDMNGPNDRHGPRGGR
ncbi:hypothetical protein AB6C94_23385 [Vibrio splendidus]|uniref:hypothetical protein n=1 Tax=Vibrio TaxID=662 RepID=UPI000066FC6E|nr:MULTISPECIES: hypothetical protein [Vibrio]EAP95638.1 hypothetical protein V12B01_02580 [Vibrio splendidus 12B01]PMJ63171.1 hypothetical protein BCU18_20155 [Vibrio lentus]